MITGQPPEAGILVIRPNPVLASRHVYETKTERWHRQWPGLTVLPWPTAG